MGGNNHHHTFNENVVVHEFPRAGLRRVGNFQVFFDQLHYQTTQGPEFRDITKDIQEVVHKSEVADGMVLVFSKHTTAGIIVNENEPLLIQDIYRFLNRVANPQEEYHHNDFETRTVNMCKEECRNGHAHCQQLLIGTSETVPIKDGKLILGRWQRVFLVELDRARERDVLIQVMGL